MNDAWFFDKQFNEVADDFFNGTLECFDFPLEDVDPSGGEEDWQAKFQDLEPPFLSNFSSDICSASTNDSIKVEGTSSVVHNESSQLKKWFRTSSPISVLESNSRSSCSADNLTTQHAAKIVITSKRPRSKGLRSQRRTYEFFHNFFAGKRLPPLAHLESQYMDETASSNPTGRPQKKKKTVIVQPADKEAMNKQPVMMRKCSHCGMTQTPQWREGPMGPKTLCNACGVRYRSGRLFPEYRPAGSPTFVPALHSNSHRKVLEMRMKTSSVSGAVPEAAQGGH